MTPGNALEQLAKAPNYQILQPAAGVTYYVDRQFSQLTAVTTAATAITMGAPSKAGLVHTVMLGTDGGDLTLTVTGGYNAAADTSITYADAGDWVTFHSVQVGSSFYWRVLASEGTTLAGGENALTGVTAGTASASKALVLDAYKAIRIGQWAASGASTNAVIFSTAMDADTQGQLDILSVFGASTSNLTSAYSAKCGRFRHIATGSSITVAQETYGLIGQVCAKGATLTHLHAGLMGTFEGTGAAVVCASSYTVGHAALIARIGGHANITATTPLAGFLAFNNASAALAAGISAAFATSSYSASYPWSVGIYMPVGSVIQAARIGAWAAAGATGSAIPISAATDSADTTQRNLVAVYGESTADLGVGIHANVGRFRHLVSGSSLSVAHETYGLVGQVNAKGVTLTHLHGGLMGTFEGTGAAVVLNSSYTTGGHGCVIARPGGHANITATTPLAGFLAFNNGTAALASGTLAAFATSVRSTSYTWTYGLYIPSGTAAQAIEAACTIGNTGRLAKLVGTVAAPSFGDGYGAIEEELDITGTAAGQTAAASTWINLGAAANTGSQTISVRDDGIYAASAATISSTKFIIGGRYQFVVEGGGNPGSLFLWATNIYDNQLTALLDVNTIIDLNYASGAASSGGIKVPFLKERSTGTTYYMNLYTS